MNYEGKFQKKTQLMYVYKHPTPMNLLQQIYSQLLIKSKRLESCDCISFWFHLSYDIHMIPLKNNVKYISAQITLSLVIIKYFHSLNLWLQKYLNVQIKYAGACTYRF